MQGRLQHDRQQRPDDPDQLEERFESREGAAACGIGRVTLQHAVERLPGDVRAERDREHGRDFARTRALHSAATSDTTPATASAKTKSGSVRRKRFRSAGLTMVPMQASRDACRGHRAEEPQWLRVALQAERDEEHEEAGRAAQHAHRRGGGAHRRALAARRARLPVPGAAAWCRPGCASRGTSRRSTATDATRSTCAASAALRIPTAIGAAEQAGDGCEAGEARVRRDEIAVVGDEPWNERALRHRIRLVEDEEREDLRVQQQVLDVARDEEAQDAAPEQGRGRDDALGTREAVDERSDDRREQQKRERG